MRDIVGARFHCAVCDSIDICSRCESAGLPGNLDSSDVGHNSSHIMIKVLFFKTLQSTIYATLVFRFHCLWNPMKSRMSVGEPGTCGAGTLPYKESQDQREAPQLHYMRRRSWALARGMVARCLETIICFVMAVARSVADFQTRF
jgi:hypothetical protein